MHTHARHTRTHTHRTVYSDPRILVGKDRIQKTQLNFLTTDKLHRAFYQQVDLRIRSSPFFFACLINAGPAIKGKQHDLIQFLKINSEKNASSWYKEGINLLSLSHILMAIAFYPREILFSLFFKCISELYLNKLLFLKALLLLRCGSLQVLAQRLAHLPRETLITRHFPPH